MRVKSRKDAESWVLVPLFLAGLFAGHALIAERQRRDIRRRARRGLRNAERQINETLDLERKLGG